MNCQLWDSKRKAPTGANYKQTIFCSDEPLQLGEMYCIEIKGWADITDWSGALRLGVTTEVRQRVDLGWMS